MENPAYWSQAERVIAQALKSWHEAQAAGIIGRSNVAAIAAALRDADLLKEPDSVKTRVYRVDFNLDTTMWNEGFEKAYLPWLRIYTDNSEWVNSLEQSYSVKDPYSPFPQNFDVDVVELAEISELSEQTQSLWSHGDDEDNSGSFEEESKSFADLLTGESSEELDKMVAKRLAEWDGI